MFAGQILVKVFLLNIAEMQCKAIYSYKRFDQTNR